MTPFQALMRVIEVLKPSDGWFCTKLTNTKVIMQHSALGRRVSRFSGNHVFVRAPHDT